MNPSSANGEHEARRIGGDGGFLDQSFKDRVRFFWVSLFERDFSPEQSCLAAERRVLVFTEQPVEPFRGRFPVLLLGESSTETIEA